MSPTGSSATLRPRRRAVTAAAAILSRRGKNKNSQIHCTRHGVTIMQWQRARCYQLERQDPRNVAVWFFRKIIGVIGTKPYGIAGAGGGGARTSVGLTCAAVYVGPAAPLLPAALGSDDGHPPCRR